MVWCFFYADNLNLQWYYFLGFVNIIFSFIPQNQNYLLIYDFQGYYYFFVQRKCLCCCLVRAWNVKAELFEMFHIYLNCSLCCGWVISTFILYLRGPSLDSQFGGLLSWLKFFSWFPAGVWRKCWDSTLNVSWLLPSMSSPLHHWKSSFHSVLYNFFGWESVIK